MEEKPSEKGKQNNIKGSSAEKVPLDLTDKMVDTPSYYFETDHRKIRRTAYQSYKGVDIGFNATNYPEFVKLTKSVYGIKTVSNIVSYSFIYDSTLEWVTNTFSNKKAEMDYCAFISQKIYNALGDYKFSFEVKYLDIEKAFNIGNVTFDFINKEFFEKRNHLPNFQDENFKDKYLGKVQVSFIAKQTEKGKAEEVCYAECCKAMDILKLFSPNVEIPDYNASYDIDRRINITSGCEYFSFDMSESDHFLITMSNNSVRFKISERQIDLLPLMGKNFIYLITLDNPNELQKLILKSMTRFSEAISNKNIYKRIIDLFTIWESLLLKDSEATIQQTVSLYGSKLLKKTLEERKLFISFFKEMYGIRSALVHHAKEVELDLEKVSRFQKETIDLMHGLIIKSHQHHTKLSLINEIDNAIHNAY